MLELEVADLDWGEELVGSGHDSGFFVSIRFVWCLCLLFRVLLIVACAHFLKCPNYTMGNFARWKIEGSSSGRFKC